MAWSTWAAHLHLVFAAAVAAAFITVGAADGNGSQWLYPDGAAMQNLKAGLELPAGSPLREDWESKNYTCEWEGVWCDEGGRVSKMDIVGCSGKGGLTTEGLGELTHLRELHGDGNLLTYIDLEVFRKLSQLQVVSLDNSPNLVMWTIPESLKTARILTHFSAPGCNLTGPIPEFLTGDTFPALRRLSLEGNKFSGIIPSDLPPTLVTLGLSGQTADYRALMGEIPDGLSRLTSLKELLLDGNSLTGPVPESLGTIRSLEQVILSYNNLSGTIPPAIANLTNLMRLDLSGNQLTGEIPHDLSRLASLQMFHADDNSLTGPVPEWLANISSLQYVSLAGNNLTGPIPPAITRSTSLRQIDLSHNEMLCGGVPPGGNNINVLTFGIPNINKPCPVG
ncbi:unnamed protein product [Cuscuta campestris]|uniref:Leucine-rich repeat-containing N-terminal plant-type domain-containing protein n=1 Tax=Cuscuta campestris TaxID=132261 RepID=A0A484MC50_9ASTE|nr:unnamed protein product [Cuscuta campestris]